MKLFNSKILLIEIKPKRKEGEIIFEDKDEVKLGKVAFSFEGENVELKKGDEIYYQYGNPAKIEGVEYVLVSENSLVCQK